MKMMVIVVESRRWLGLVDIEGQVYKFTLWPGSATEEWRALLQPATWVELSEGKIPRAISEAKKVYDVGPEPEPQGDSLEELYLRLKMDESKKDLLAEIEEVMRGE